jgi:putative inorganic carbon (HCO3(-)) transporter
MNGARLVRLVASAELAIVVAIAPALLFPSPGRLAVLAVVPVVWFCARTAGGRVVPRTPLNAAVWLLLAMVVVSLYATFDIRFSLGKVSGVLLGTLLFWASARRLTTSAALKVGTVGFVLAGVGLAIVGLLGANGASKFPVLGVLAARLPVAIRGVPGAEDGFNPNAVAGCLVLFVPLQVALVTAGLHRWLVPTAKSRWVGTSLVIIQVMLLALTVGTLLLMQSRGAWAGLVVASVAFLVWHSRRTRVLGAVAALTVIVVAGTLGAKTLGGLAVSRAGPGMAGTISGRMALWSSAIYAIQDFPFTGMGMNAFRRVMPVMYQASLISPDIDVAHAHNHVLQAALDLGIPGVVAYASIWLSAAALLVVVYRRADERIYRAMASGLGAGFIAYFVFGMTDTIALGSKVGVLFWLMLALTVGLHRVATGEAGLRSV